MADHDWQTFSDEQYAGAALEAARDRAAEIAERSGQYRVIAAGPWLEGKPPQLVLVVSDDDGGRYERRYDLQFRFQPPSVARYLVNDAVARLPLEHDQGPRSREEVWRDLRSLSWPRSPEALKAVVPRPGSEPRIERGRLSISALDDDVSEMRIEELPICQYRPSDLQDAQLWTTEGNSLFRLQLEFSWGSVQLLDSQERPRTSRRERAPCRAEQPRLRWIAWVDRHVRPPT